MFDFTKEVVINSADKFTVVAAHDNVPAKFRVHGGGEYFGGYVVEKKAYKTAPAAGSVAELTLDLVKMKEGLTEGDLQILVELGLDRGDARGDWGSAMYYFKKPLMVTVSYDATADVVAKAFTKVASGYGLADVEVSGENVVIKGGDDKIKVRSVVVKNILKDDVKDVAYDWAANYVANAVEFGTANYLLHNLRMPTYENYRFTSPAAVEMPVAGTNYVQFSFLYCVPRPGLGGLSVAGQTNHSTTTHVFFVAEAAAEEFASKLAEIGVEVVEITVSGTHSAHNVDILPDAMATVDMVDGE